MNIVAGLSTITSALIGGLISSSVITYLLGARRAEREVLRTKLEILYAELSRSIRHLQVEARSAATDTWRIENGRPVHDDIQDETDKPAHDTPLIHDKHIAVINIYFPGVINAYEAYFSAYQRVNSELMGAQIDLTLNRGTKELRHQRAMQIADEMMTLGRDLHEALLYEADKINCPSWRRVFLKKRSNPLF